MAEDNKTNDQKKIDPKKQKLSLAEYQTLQAKEAKKFKGIKLPLAVQIILALPLIAIFLFGVFWIPFIAIKGCSPSTPTTSK